LKTNLRSPNFLNLAPPLSDRAGARFHILPAPLEETVSYGKGTCRGPRAILEASTKVEPFDGESTPAEVGIFTDRAVDLRGAGSEGALRRIETRWAAILCEKRIPVMLGGEHTVTLAAARALKTAVPDVGIVQFDAHSDLWHEYDGTPYSHACVMHRILELGLPLFQIGVRSGTGKDSDLRRQHRVGFLDAGDLAHRRSLPRRVLPPGFPHRIYVTFDVDAFDPSLVPSTGTPEPGGLNWYQAVDLLGAVLRGRELVGFDVVELAPVPGFPASDFVVAKLVYTIMGMALRGGCV